MTAILLCSDLDRTLLPNGPQPESPQARPLLRKFVERPEVTLAYVSGRHEALLREAIEMYQIPIPDFAIGDVGTTIYEITSGEWHPSAAWSDEIALDWIGASWTDINALFYGMPQLSLQEKEKQSTYKLSYYVSLPVERDTIIKEMEQRLVKTGIQAAVIWSVDETANIGLIDVLPATATKLHAVQFLMDRLKFSSPQTIFAGDSGNDLPVLTSGLQSILVKNALPEVKKEAQAIIARENVSENLYLAQGGFLNMNGNYSAGILEGIAHFIPQLKWGQI